MNRKKKWIAAGAAVAVAAVLAVTGTLAWQSLGQETEGEKSQTVNYNPGGRLHDEFDGTKKYVYVENFTSEAENGEDIFARVRLDEYMETGRDAGMPADTQDRQASAVLAGTSFESVSTWRTRTPTTADEVTERWSWNLDGGQKWYMPTFNKMRSEFDSSSSLITNLTADINGTYEKNYTDYVEMKQGQKYTSEAWLPDQETKVEEHETRQTINGTVITMDEWLMNPVAGDYWVWDSDGWFYWANPIKPGTATGLLLGGIEMIGEATEHAYYGINAVGQFVTAGDTGVIDWFEGWTGGDTSDTGTGFYDPVKPTDNAENLLQVIGAEGVKIIADKDAFTPGGTVQFSAVSVASGTMGKTLDNAWWVLEDGYTSADTKINQETGLLTVGADERASYLTVTVSGTETDAGSGYGRIALKNSAIQSICETIREIDINNNPGSDRTVTIDGIEWYVLAEDKEENKALLLSKHTLDDRYFDDKNASSSDTPPIWGSCSLRNYLNGEWLDSKPTIKACAKATTLYTVGTTHNDNYTGFEQTEDTVFLLSEADVYGTTPMGTKLTDLTLVTDIKYHYIAGKQLTAPGNSWIATTYYNGLYDTWWLRDVNYHEAVRCVNRDGKNSWAPNFSGLPNGVRPAFWFDLSK